MQRKESATTGSSTVAQFGSSQEPLVAFGLVPFSDIRGIKLVAAKQSLARASRVQSRGKPAPA